MHLCKVGGKLGFVQLVVAGLAVRQRKLQHTAPDNVSESRSTLVHAPAYSPNRWAATVVQASWASLQLPGGSSGQPHPCLLRHKSVHIVRALALQQAQVACMHTVWGGRGGDMLKPRCNGTPSAMPLPSDSYVELATSVGLQRAVPWHSSAPHPVHTPTSDPHSRSSALSSSTSIAPLLLRSYCANASAASAGTEAAMVGATCG